MKNLGMTIDRSSLLFESKVSAKRNFQTAHNRVCLFCSNKKGRVFKSRWAHQFFPSIEITKILFLKKDYCLILLVIGFTFIYVSEKKYVQISMKI